MKTARPVEAKVTNATIAAVVSSAIVWALTRYVFGGEVPVEIAALVQVLVPAAVTYAAGYLTAHTRRADLGDPPVVL